MPNESLSEFDDILDLKAALCDAAPRSTAVGTRELATLVGLEYTDGEGAS